MMPEETVSLRDYLDLNIHHLEAMAAAQKELSDQHFLLNELAIDKAQDSIDLRMETTNEWRGQSKDREAQFATKDTVGSLEKSVKALELAGAKIAGKADQSDVFTAKMFAIVGVVTGLAGIIIGLLK